MEGKIYKARSIQKALAVIKEELGPDAMILSTRRVPKSPRDPYAEDMFEVEAAPKDAEGRDGSGSDDGLDDWGGRGRGDWGNDPHLEPSISTEARNAQRQFSQKSQVDRQRKTSTAGRSSASTSRSNVSTGRSNVSTGRSNVSTGRSNAPVKRSLHANKRTVQSAAHIKDAPRTAQTNQPPNSPWHAKGGARLEKENKMAMESSISDAALFDELASIKDLISLVGFGSGMASILGNYPESAGIYASLLRAGISEKRAHWVLQKATFAMESDQAERTGLNYPLKKYVIKECLDLIRTRELFCRPTNSGMPHVAAFVGPTGVGKTTTIAKLAAELSIKRKKRVGLISIDNYRIGAFEQLKSYAAIMGLLCLAAFNREDLTRALKKMEFMDIVLIDTAGHSHSDHLRMQEVSEVIQGDFNISIHLVLSLTTGFLDMREAANAFSKLNPESYVFTKVDETKRCGKMFDQISDLQLPVSLVTNGQRVPEDLIIPDTRDLLGIMLGAEQGGEKV